MISKAHYDSKNFVIDPAHSIHGVYPEEQNLNDAPYWHYGHYECEAFLLEKMVRRKDEAKLLVGYTKYRRKPAAEAYFSLESVVGGTIEFRATGNVEVFFNNGKIYSAAPSAERHEISLPTPGKLMIHLAVDDVKEDLPALLPLNVVDGWRYSTDGIHETDPVCRPQREDGSAPHHAELPQIPLTAQIVAENVWDAGVELLCYVDIICDKDATPELYFGESIPEMENEDPQHEEQTRELVCNGPGLWSSKVPLALRYIRLKNAGKDPEISLRALFHPAEYKGAMAIHGEDDLTKIWMNSAYTLRLCMHNFLLDGIKRDRLPWAGDLAVSLLGNAFSFADRGLVRDSLSVLCANGIQEAHINTIPDYTMWWLINHEYYQLYYGDPEFLKLEYPRITETIDILLSKRDENGFLIFSKKDFPFIDWVPGKKDSAVQILFARGLQAGAALAKRMNDDQRAAMLEKEAEKLVAVIREKMFCKKCGLFVSAPGEKEILRHANLLAVVFGYTSKEEAEVIAEALAGHDLPPVGTPYMSVFEAKAIALAGNADDAIARIREIWGGMLNLGATTFWEGFDPAHNGKEHYVFYDRAYGKSLCHAWGAGPLFLLPELFAGITPVEDGWRKFRLDPLPGADLSITIPVPGGVIEAEIENGKIISCSAPEGCEQIR